MTVVSAMRSIVISINTEGLVFSLKKGSAQCDIVAPSETIDLIYEEIDLALKGESTDKEVTSNLRRIQDQFKRQDYDYKFLLKEPRGTFIVVHKRIIESNRISIKRSKKPYSYRVKVLSGFLNQIGGKIPNYHFDYGHGQKKIISCTQDQALSINQYLYHTIDVLAVCKEWTDPDRQTEYTHKLILEAEDARLLQLFLINYNRQDDLVDRLTVLHDFMDEQLTKSKDPQKVLKLLLQGFNDRNLHLSEIKTLLVISKPFAQNQSIRDARAEMLETYTLIKNQQ